MQYTISEIENGVAKVLWSDGSWTFIEMNSDMTEADFDDEVFRSIPPQLKTGSSPERNTTNVASQSTTKLHARNAACGQPIRPCWDGPRAPRPTIPSTECVGRELYS